MVRAASNPPRLIIELPGREPYIIENYKIAYHFVMQACYALKEFHHREAPVGQSKS